MIVYLDTNVYIGAKYQFSSDKFATLRSLISDGTVQVIYSTATLGEVEQHISSDIKAGVSQYNRLLRKDLLPLTVLPEFGLSVIGEEDALGAVRKELSNFLSSKGVTQIALNPLDAEQLMADFFQGKAPFESKKPYEFKDAIVINAVKQYQRTVHEPIVIVSNDDGFRRVFEQDPNFITVKFLSDLFRICQEQKEEYARIEDCIAAANENDEFCELIKDYFSNFDVDRGYYSEWECNELQIDAVEADLAYVEFAGGKYLAHVNAVLYLMAEITHRDEDTSYYDREEQRYLIENYVTWREKHQVEMDITIACSVEKDSAGEYTILTSEVFDDRKFRTFDLDEDTLQDWDEIETELHEEPDLVYCNECGKVLGYIAEYTDYDDNPLCSSCMVSNSKGDICPTCGRKVPHELMISGFCHDCFREHD